MGKNEKEEKIKKRDKSIMDIDRQKEQQEIEMNQRHPDMIKYLPSNYDDRTRKDKEKARLQQDERNAGLRVDSNGDINTVKGAMLYDRTFQGQAVEKWKEDIEKQRILNGKKTPDKEIYMEERIKK